MEPLRTRAWWRAIAVTGTLALLGSLSAAPASAQGGPTFRVEVNDDAIFGGEWLGPVAVTITRPDGTSETFSGVPVDETGFFMPNGGGPFYDFRIGDVVTVVDSDGTAKELTLTPIAITALDPDTDVLSGICTSAVSENVQLHEDETSQGATVPCNADGTFDASGAFDVTGEFLVNASQDDADGDGVAWQWHPGDQGPAINANLDDDAGYGYNFTTSTAVTIDVFDFPGGTNLFSGNAAGTWPDSFFSFGYDVPLGVDLVPGMYVTASDGAITKALELAAITYDILDPDTDTASGTAQAGATVVVEAAYGDDELYHSMNVVADVNGHWAADFGADGFDVIPGMFGNAGVADEDGDMTWDNWYPPVFEVAITPEPSSTPDTIFACCDEGWTADSSVTVTIFDGPGGSALYGPAVIPTDSAGDFRVSPEVHGLDLVPGMVVVVTDDTTSITKQLVLAEMSFDALDPDANVASGTAPSGAEVWVEPVVPYEEGEFALTVVADDSGAWFADFGAEGFDVTPFMGGTAIIDDEDGDSTRAGILPPWCPAPEGGKALKTCEIGWTALGGYDITVGTKIKLFLNGSWGWASDPSLTDPSNYEEEFLDVGYTFTMRVDGVALPYELVMEEEPNSCGPRGDTGEEQCADVTWARWQYLVKRLSPGVHTVSFELTLLKDFPDDGWGYSVSAGDVFYAANTVQVVRR